MKQGFYFSQHLQRKMEEFKKSLCQETKTGNKWINYWNKKPYYYILLLVKPAQSSTETESNIPSPGQDTQEEKNREGEESQPADENAEESEKNSREHTRCTTKWKHDNVTTVPDKRNNNSKKKPIFYEVDKCFIYLCNRRTNKKPEEDDSKNVLVKSSPDVRLMDEQQMRQFKHRVL